MSAPGPRAGSSARVARAAWAVVAWNLLVILWGAWVRLSGSGAGCGSHWPLCDGEILPRAPSVEKAIEFTHRVTSGLALLAVVALGALAARAFERAHPARRAAAWAVVFVVIEALLGAGLVLFGLVARDASPARALVLPLHLVNTFLLLAALALAAHFAGGAPPAAPRAGRPAALWLGALALLALAGASGAVAALGDTLFPARALGEALAQDLSSASHFLLRLRLAHPALAAAAALAVFFLVWRTPEERPGLRARRTAGALALAQLVVGVANVALLAPAALQLAHLLLADLLWIASVVAAARAAAS
jgi:heme A synthase